MQATDLDFPAFGFSYDEEWDGYTLFDVDGNMVCYIAHECVERSPEFAKYLILIAAARIGPNPLTPVH